jgi:hypothetical protein
VVVLNYNGGDLTLRCLEHLSKVDWPEDRREYVVVDNGSTDGSLERCRERFPDLTYIEAGKNLGFAGGNNLGLADLEDVDHVVLLNNDAFVEPGWLKGLVDVAESASDIGAVNSKLLFAPRFIDSILESSTQRVAGDPRDLGVRVSGVRVDGREVWGDAHFLDGFFPAEHGPEPESSFRWTGRLARFRIPVPLDSMPARAEMRIASPLARSIKVGPQGRERVLEVGVEPAWFEVPLEGEPIDVVQNAGSELMRGVYGRDRGFLDPDEGQFEEVEEVWAWCGGSSLLKKEYLEDVGILDERFFVYYEDFDLSWRGRSRGWRYLYSPSSVVRHVHAATSGEWSPLFQHYVDRNRLLVMTKNASVEQLASGLWHFLLTIGSTVFRDVVTPGLKGRRPSFQMLRRRLGSFGGYLKLLPEMLKERRKIRRRAIVSDDKLMTWMIDP